MNNLENFETMIISYDTENILDIKFVKNYLRIDNDEDDFLIKNYIETAILFAEQYLGKELCDKNIECSFFTQREVKKIQNNIFKNIKKEQIISIKNNDISIENFNIENNNIIFENTISGAVNITLLKHSNFKTISSNLKQALLCHIASMYQNKDGNCEIPKTALQIYSFNKDIKIGL